MKTTTTFRQKDSGWQIIISWKDTSGQWHQRSKQGFRKKADAKAYEAALIEQIKKQPAPADQALAGITLEKFCEIFLLSKQSIAPNTKTNYTAAVRSLQDVAKKPVHTITYLDLQKAVSAWKIKPQTQKQYKTKLDVLFRAAVKPYGLIAANPMKDIEIKKDRQKKERLTVSADQFRRMIAGTRTDAAVALAICYYAGLRRGELFGLTWEDIGWSGQTIRINKQLQVHGKKVTEPKSRNGFRTVPIPQPLLQLLRDYHCAVPLDYKRRLFPHPQGTLEKMQAALRAEDPAFTPHCLRHTYATTLLAKGIDIRTVAALMGDDTKTVINTYVHYTDEMRAAAAAEIKKIFL